MSTRYGYCNVPLFSLEDKLINYVVNTIKVDYVVVWNFRRVMWLSCNIKIPLADIHFTLHKYVCLLLSAQGYANYAINPAYPPLLMAIEPKGFLINLICIKYIEIQI